MSSSSWLAHPVAIPFNKPYLAGRELLYMEQAVRAGHISGDGPFTRRCSQWLTQRYGFGRALLTTSGTDALELAALLCRIEPGDEVIVPSYTFVSTANAFVLRGARIVFADSGPDSPHLDAEQLAALITPRTRAIVPVHYAGMGCQLDLIADLAQRHGLWVVEDAAQAINGYFQDRPLGTWGQLAAFSFHETKNISAGEGGMLAVNEAALQARAEIIREKGTNRAAYFRGEVDKYTWVDVGSSFLPSDLTAAFLWGQLEELDHIQARRSQLWQLYYQALQPLQTAGVARLPVVPAGASNNAHLFYLVCRSLAERSRLIEHLRRHGILAVFHYQSLHRSPFFAPHHDGRPLPHADRYSDCLVRLPLFHELSEADVLRICELVTDCLLGRT
ncbi:dTDP-4-amino-4,6-dideoxygalactose transaminase [Hymenobacter sp. B81]|uniref:dTDP-4-amino-4,6-dideoxygalactose transaminase n=1 Tax=Hymenobacter sp. B81 TaxID=3344878 RepID=UPI0037DCC84C